MISSSPCLRYSLICPASTFAAPIERIFPLFQCVQRIYSFRNRRKTGLYGLPVGHIDINGVDTQPLQAGFHLFANRLRREIFVQLTIANFVKQAARPLPDDATFGFDNDIVTRQLFSACPTITSLLPKLYPGAVSIRLMPQRCASTMVSMQTCKSRSPFHAGPPPIAHVPNPMRESLISVLPKGIIFICRYYPSYSSRSCSTSFLFSRPLWHPRSVPILRPLR